MSQQSQQTRRLVPLAQPVLAPAPDQNPGQPPGQGGSAAPQTSVRQSWPFDADLVKAFIWKAIKRWAGGGIKLGAIYGFIAPLLLILMGNNLFGYRLLALCVGVVLGSIIGLIAGLLLGLLCGLALAATARLWFYPVYDELPFQAMGSAVAVGVTLVGMISLLQQFPDFRLLLYSPRDGASLILIYVPMLIATLYATRAGKRVMDWYSYQIGVSSIYKPEVQQQLGNVLQPHYDYIAECCSFGQYRRWRARLLELMDLTPGMRVADLMCGSGTTWEHILPRIGPMGDLVALDFAPQAVSAARDETQLLRGGQVVVLAEDVLHSSLPPAGVDAVVCAYGVAALDAAGQLALVQQLQRMLAHNGIFGLVEISAPPNALSGALMRAYLCHLMPLLAALCGGNWRAFTHYGNCLAQFDGGLWLEHQFIAHGFQVHRYQIDGGCATMLVGMKLAGKNP